MSVFSTKYIYIFFIIGKIEYNKQNLGEKKNLLPFFFALVIVNLEAYGGGENNILRSEK